MPTREELNKNQVLDWSAIRPVDTKPALLLGNGFSLLFSSNFSYKSLFDLFLGTCNAKQKVFFQSFDTNNFELILKYLMFALKVNTLLGLSTIEISTAINQLKNGLIRVIESVHPRTEDINFTQLRNIAAQLNNFGDIFTTNYDLYLYHIIMLSKDLYSENSSNRPYQDWFWGSNAPAGFLEFMSYQMYVQYKNVFYLHGSLFIFNHGISAIKLKKNGNATELIDLISRQIRNNNIPLFISEGTGQYKKDCIENNNYLIFCLDKLKNLKKSIMVFGNGLSEFDSHILNALKENKRNIYYCIYPEGKSIPEIKKEKESFSLKMSGYTGSIIFVDSTTVFNL